MIVERREFANYLRENSGVKDRRTSSEIHDACSAKLERRETAIKRLPTKALPDHLVNQIADQRGCEEP
jgi:hypothetical protein